MARMQERGKCRGISYSLPNSLLRIPIRMRRPSTTGKALGLIPLVKAGWANASSVEGVPLVVALAKPFVFLARRPAAQRTADARRFRNFAISIDDRIV